VTPLQLAQLTADTLDHGPDADSLQVHDLYDAAVGDGAPEFTVLAEHCTACGQPLPEVTA
jgi:hypothetical protein